MAERSLRLRLGLFVAAALGILSVLVVLFGGTPTLFTNRARYTVVFPEAPGVAPGTPVRKAGVRIGEVTSLDLDEATGQVRVSVEVDPRHGPRTGEEPVISRGFLSGDTALDFVPKTAPEGQPVANRGEPYPRGAVIPGVPPVSARTLLGQAQTVIPTAQESLVRMSESVQKFERAAPKIERAAEEFGALSRSVREFVPELRQTNVRLQELLGAADPQPDPLKPPEERVTIRAVLQDIRDLLRAIKPVADDLRAQLKTTGPELDKTLQALRTAVESANDLLNPENRKAVTALIKSLQVTTDDLTKTIRLAALTLDQAEKTFKEFSARAAQAERAIGNVERLTRPFAENADQLHRDITETARNLNAVSAELARVLKALNQPDGTVQKLIADPSLYNNLNESAVGVARILARLEKVVRDLEVFADKIARKPETIGIGGALHPSTGLKESPTAPLPPTPTPPLPPSQQPVREPVAPIPPVPFGAGEPVPVYKPAGGPDLPPPPRR